MATMSGEPLETQVSHKHILHQTMHHMLPYF